MTETPANDRRDKRVTTAVAVALVLVFFVFYTANSSDTVSLNHGDAALLQVIGSLGGIPHQPYPLWCVLSNAAVLVPFGEPAGRVTRLSILFASIAVGLLFGIIVGYTNDYLSAVTAAAAFGLSHSFWHNAEMAEVYSLSVLLVLLVIYFLFRWLATSDVSALLLSVLSLGFAVSHHQLNIALFPPFLFVLYSKRKMVRRTMTVRMVLSGFGLFLLPFTLYLYTFIMDRNPHAMNWLNAYGRFLYADTHTDVDRFDGFIERIRFQMWAARYGQVIATPVELGSRLYHWFGQLVKLEFPLLGPALIGMGMVSLWRRDRWVSMFWLIFVLSFVFLAINGPRGGGLALTYSIPVYAVFSIYLAMGLVAVRNSPARRKALSTAAIWVLAALVVGLPLVSHSTAFARLLSSGARGGMSGVSGPFWHLKANNDNGGIYARSIKASVPEGSLIFTGWAEGNVLYYYKFVKKDLEDIDTHFIVNTRYLPQIVRDKRPRAVYFTRSPEALGLEVESVVKIEPDRELFKVEDSIIAAWLEEQNEH